MIPQCFGPSPSAVGFALSFPTFVPTSRPGALKKESAVQRTHSLPISTCR